MFSFFFVSWWYRFFFWKYHCRQSSLDNHITKILDNDNNDSGNWSSKKYSPREGNVVENMVRYVSSIRFIKSVMYYKGTIVDDWLISFWWIVCVLNIIMKAFLQQLFPPEGTSSWRDHNLMHITYHGQTTTLLSNFLYMIEMWFIIRNTV